MNEHNERDESFRMLSSVGDIGDDLLQEANDFLESPAEEDTVRTSGTVDAKKKNRFSSFFRSHRAGLIAASLAVVLLAGVLIPVFLLNKPTDEPTDKPNPAVSDDPVIDPIQPSYNSDVYTEVPDALRQLTVTAESENGEPVSGRIIPTKAVLRVQTSSACDTDTLTNYVRVSPSVPLSVTKESDTSFLLQPAGTAFAPDTVYRLTVGDPENPDASFAFQTASEPRIQSVLPADRRTNVPVSTGIEIAFSEAVRANTSELSSYFSISPDVKGFFQISTDGKTVAFVPEQNLAYDTVYTVTVGSGLTGVSGKPIADGKTFSFRTVSEASEKASVDFIASVYDAFTNRAQGVWTVYSPKSTIRIAADLTLYNEQGSFVPYRQSQELLQNGKVKVTAAFYRAKDLSKVSEALLKSEERVFNLEIPAPEPDLSLFEKTSEWTFAHDGERNRMQAEGHLDEEGFYVAEIKATYRSVTTVRYLMISVSSLRYGALTSDGSTLLYVTDDSGNPVAKAAVEGTAYDAGEGESGLRKEPFRTETASDGTVLIENGECRYMLFRVSAAGKELLVFGSGAVTDDKPYYLTTMYTDRTVYFSTDTIRVWGTVRRQYTEDPYAEGCYYLATPFDSRKFPVVLDENGCFEAEISIEDVESIWGGSVRLVDAEDRTVSSRSIRVTQEEKPVVNGTIEFDKPFYTFGETIVGVFRAAFFDGTPAPGYQIQLNASTFSVYQSGNVTDEDGELHFSIPLGVVKTDSTEPYTISVRGYLTGEGTDQVDVRATVPYYHSDYVYRIERTEDHIRLLLNERDFAGFPDDTIGQPANGYASISLIKYTLKVTESTEYDSYSKRRYTVYSTDISESTVKTEILDFVNGVIELDYVESDDDKVWYSYEATFHDGHNAFRLGSSAQKYRRTSYYDTGLLVNLTPDKTAYLPGETVHVSLTGAAVPDQALYAFYSNGYISHAAGKEASLLFAEDMIPALNCWALYFDPATAAISLASTTVTYDVENAVRDMTVRTDSGTYRPGEQAAVTVSAPGLAGGQALISITDEACFALGENDYDVRGFFAGRSSAWYSYLDLYYITSYMSSSVKQVSSFRSQNFFSSGRLANNYRSSDGWYEEGVADAAEEPGSELSNGDIVGSVETYIRERFEDTAAFVIVPIGADGTGSLLIDLPDNLTTWRVTAIGFRAAEKTSECAFGMAVSDTVVTLPMQVKAELNTRYVEGDSVVAGFRCFGAHAEGTAAYTVSLTDETGTEYGSGSLTGDAGTITYASFGKLNAGSYTLTVTAACGGDTDGLRKTFRVVSSAQTVERVADATDADALSGLIQPAVYPVTVYFRNASGDDLFLQRIANALRYAGGSAQRSDAAAAAEVAKEWLSRQYGIESASTTDAAQFENYLDTTGDRQFYALFPYAEGNVGLTAQLLDAAPELLGSKSVLIDSFRSILISVPTEEDLCAALYGLAVAGEPVLDKLSLIASRAGSYTAEAKLYLANGFAAIGDYASASAILNGLIDEYGREADKGDVLSLSMGDVESDIRCTSLALLAASRVSRATAKKFAAWLIEMPHRSGESPDLALAVFLTRHLPTESQTEKTVRYTLADGEEREIKLAFGRSACIRLYKADFEALRIDNPDKANVTAVYMGAPDPEADTPADGSLNVTKTIDGDTVRIRISGTTDKRYDYLRIEDVIPSGARFLPVKGRWSSAKGTHCNGTLVYTEGQLVEGYVYIWQKLDEIPKNENRLYCDPYSFSIELTYSIRDAIAGEFIVEPVRVTDCDGKVACSEPFSVTLADGASVTEITLR